MKRILYFLTAVFMLLGMSFAVDTRAAYAEFAERPVAFVVLDSTGEVSGRIYSSWRQTVKWSYHFPDYQIVDDGTANKVTREVLATADKVTPEVLQEICEKSKVDVIVLAQIYDMSVIQVYGWGGFFHDGFGETYYQVSAVADLYRYEKDGGKFNKKKVRERVVREMGNFDDPAETIKWKLCDVMEYFKKANNK